MNTPADRLYISRLLANAEREMLPHDPAQRYAELLGHCARIKQEREAAVNRARFFAAKYLWWHSPRTNWGEIEATITAAMSCFTHRDRIEIGKLNIVRAEAGQ